MIVASAERAPRVVALIEVATVPFRLTALDSTLMPAAYAALKTLPEFVDAVDA